ncbi:Transcription initiation factor IIA large subunit [Escovopsis weberi]|uniref:Transcription initiation factor IIA large subunit n=1 Tax=Escovopsis weberi TaxID=150374 RepID=A0A0M8N436_ESCWE|nr:Transcription initiation factor IIA large subunit [Escovopsis weberi]
MSNQAVGSVYQTIIDEVVNSSRVDFEESGVEEAVLEELRLSPEPPFPPGMVMAGATGREWQKLSQLDVARFPWDPKPDPPPVQVNVTPPQPIIPTHTQAQFTSQPAMPTGELPHGLPANVDIKPEPGFIKPEPGAYMHIKNEPGMQQGPSPAYPAPNGKDMGNVAHARAAHLLEQYGPRAAGSINAIQNHTDGAGDAFEGSLDGDDEENESESDLQAVLLRRGITGNIEELGRVEVDRILHDQIAARARSMEGGGLMLSLKEATKHRTSSAAARKFKGKQRAVAAFDGGDDDDEIDEDAINSDLDDSDEPGDEDEVDDEGLGHIMLCMYDKVQRVKNKWKCTLKDGVLTVNGKEYVFSKATGEYEW